MKTLKTIILIAAMGMISYNSFGQKVKDVPQAIKTDFTSKYPAVDVKNWRMENHQYIASFILNRRHCKATYNSDGAWVSTAITMRHIKNLAPDIKASLRHSPYSSYHIDMVQTLKTPSKDMYVVEVDNNSGNKMLYDNIGSFDDRLLYFSQNGHLLRSVNNSNQ